MDNKKQCSSCGAPLKSIGWGKFKCEYCGTEYREDSYRDQVQFIQVNAPHCHTLVAKAMIDDYWIQADKELASKSITNQLTVSLADTLKEYLTIEEEIDPLNCRRIYRGMIRVVPPDYRY